MPSDCISYEDSGYFTPLIKDYLNQKAELEPLYHRFPTLENFKAQCLEKQQNFKASNREILVSVLNQQYENLEASTLTRQNIAALASDQTFTITTGHQLNLFTGPLYFLYKIISTLNLSKKLKIENPDYNFVPVYWMATEDHDFEEINYFNFKGKKFRWHQETSGAVGRLSTQGLEEVFKVFATELGSGNHADYLKNLFEDAYLKHDTLAQATRFLANALFGKEGLVILDADHRELKKLFIPYVREELLHQTAEKEVLKATEKLQHYTVQVNPRNINLFYLKDGLRERIILSGGIYEVHNTRIFFTREEILAELQQHPENFSPNVIMRPLYQEVILPNLCYIGGGGELAYWLELKHYFEASKVTFPILLLRNAVLLATKKQKKKALKMGLQLPDLFKKQPQLVNEKVKALSEFPIDFRLQKEFLNQQFEALDQMAQQTDPSFTGAVKAQRAKQISGLENLEKRLLKAQKKKHAQELERLKDLQNELFPFQGLQERQANFSEFYQENGALLKERLLLRLDPLKNDFEILVF